MEKPPLWLLKIPLHKKKKSGLSGIKNFNLQSKSKCFLEDRTDWIRKPFWGILFFFFFWRANLREVRKKKRGVLELQYPCFPGHNWLCFYWEIFICSQIKPLPREYKNFQDYKYIRVAVKSGILSDTLFFFFLQHPLIWILTNTGTSVWGGEKGSTVTFQKQWLPK